jgi:predicted transcriptional regulator
MHDEQQQVDSLQGFIYGLNYFLKRGYDPVDLQVLCGIKMIRLRAPMESPRVADLVKTLRLPACSVEKSLQVLEDNGLVHREIPKYGDLDKSTYRLAAKGGTMMKKMLQP